MWQGERATEEFSCSLSQRIGAPLRLPMAIFHTNSFSHLSNALKTLGESTPGVSVMEYCCVDWGWNGNSRMATGRSRCIPREMATDCTVPLTRIIRTIIESRGITLWVMIHR